MLYPSVIANDLFDEIFEGFVRPARPSHSHCGGPHPVRVMKTDVRELDNSYLLDIDLPGIKKEDVTVSLKDGALEIKAVSQTSDEEKDENGKYLRRERFFGSCSRSFYVGDDVKQEDIKAKFENGILSLTVPKLPPKEAIDTRQYISID